MYRVVIGKVNLKWAEDLEVTARRAQYIITSMLLIQNGCHCYLLTSKRQRNENDVMVIFLVDLWSLH